MTNFTRSMKNIFHRLSLVEFSVSHPRLVLILSLIITVAFLGFFPKMKIDTNPKHMLPDTSDVRVWNDEVDKTFSLYEDTIVLGIVNDSGILDRETLGRIIRITDEVMKINGVAARDVNSFSTITNVTSDAGDLRVAPLLTEVPQNDEETEHLGNMLFGNPLFTNRIISKDGKATAIYIPLEKGANGKEIADRIRQIVKKEQGAEKYYVAGDPVARDTFGSEMFKLMGIFSPIAALIMLLAIYLMFRNLALSMSMMAVAMISIIWSMGLLIGLGYPVHIMSSMSPVFLMAIATDSIHIFNEFYFRYREKRNKRLAIIETMEAVGRPVRFTALATAASFAVLVFMHIIPVKVFGLLIAFGTIVLRLLSFSFIPAVLTFVSEKKLDRLSGSEDNGSGLMARILRGIGGIGIFRPRATVTIGIIIFVISVIGTTQIHVNNNMVGWFKKGSEIRTADTVMNQALGGTSLGYVVAISGEDDFIKSPEAMRSIEKLQRKLEEVPDVGKTFSVVDYVKRINQVLHDDRPEFNTVPDNKETIGQYLFLFSMSAKPSDLENVVDYPYRKANIWVQMKSWDAQVMRDVIAATEEFKKSDPAGLDYRPAGTAYFNLVWNDEVLWDMVRGFIIALIVVFVILSFNFRSVKWATIGYIPLLFTVLFIYGIVGFTGKDFDMPISVLSALSLGMAVDFAIHFISRFKQRFAEGGPGSKSNLLADSLLWTAGRPGKGIMRNAFLFAAAFSVMLFAPITPYITVGAFIVGMMMLSAFMTLILLPALIVLLKGWLLKGSFVSDATAQKDHLNRPQRQEAQKMEFEETSPQE